MKNILVACLLFALSTSVLAREEYYLEYNRPGEKHPIKYGPMKTLQECQEEMARFLGKFGNKIVNPRCIKK